MIDLGALQKRVYQNKVNHRFNVTDVPFEFALAYGEMGEAFEAWIKKWDNLGEELADVMIYLLGIAEITGVDLEAELLRKIEINEKRKYVMKDGIMQKDE